VFSVPYTNQMLPYGMHHPCTKHPMMIKAVAGPVLLQVDPAA
jgi:hypothetical protein